MTPDTIPAPPPGWAIVPADDARLDCLPSWPKELRWIDSVYIAGNKVPQDDRDTPYALPIEPCPACQAIHEPGLCHAQPWSLPAPPAGLAWHRQDWTAEMLPEGWRPLLAGERFIAGQGNDEYELPNGDFHWQSYPPHKTDKTRQRTRRPLPASQPEQASQAEPSWQAVIAEAKAKEAVSQANNPLFSGKVMPPLWADHIAEENRQACNRLTAEERQNLLGIAKTIINGTDPKGEAGKAKAPLALLPPEALRQAAWAHGNGAAKYGVANWRENQINATTYISAMMRHIGQYLDGEDKDTESGLSHLAHVIASANILIDAKHCGTLVDDRPKRPA